MKNNRPILGTTLYSFTNEWQLRLFDLEQLLAKVSEQKLGPAVEVVGFQSIRSYPDVTDEFASKFRTWFDKYELMPSCLGANMDVGRRKGQDMTPDEIVEYSERQIITARKLGFPVLRAQVSAGPGIFEKLAPIAEREKVHVACELHSPMTADHPFVVELMELYDKLQTEYLGFIPDFSSTMNDMPAIHLAQLRENGAPEELLDTVKEIWHSGKPPEEKFGAMAEAGNRFKVDAKLTGFLNRSLTMFGNMPPDGLSDLLPYTRHIHGKFYHVNEEGFEPSIPYKEIMGILKREGYSGTISAEWEGHAFTGDQIGFKEVQAWRAMCERFLAD